VPENAAISATLIALGPAVMAGVMAGVLFRRRRGRAGGARDAGAARLIITATVIAAAFVTLGILIAWRRM